MLEELNNTIESIIKANQHILDCGCGDGTLLTLLQDKKHISGYGIDIDESNIVSCIKKNIPVYHGDILEGLRALPDKSFDVVIKSISFVSIKKVKEIKISYLFD